jgi:hypothetical protein
MWAWGWPLSVSSSPSSDSGTRHRILIITDSLEKVVIFFSFLYLYIFGDFLGFQFGMNLHWDYTIVWNNSPFLLIAVAQRRVPHGAGPKIEPGSQPRHTTYYSLAQLFFSMK